MPGGVARPLCSSSAWHDGCTASFAMQSMPATVDAADVALRLGLTVLAGLLIGYNRREHGKAARRSSPPTSPVSRACSDSSGRPLA